MTSPMIETSSAPPIDTRLLAGFSFSCRPDCGLCCYAEPRVLRSERVRLLEIVPEAEIVGRAPDEYLAARPNGGACGLLQENRCRAHVARPHPCREFPLTAHVGTRLQATVVLSCPGVDLAPLARFGSDSSARPALGFLDELAALQERVDSAAVRRLATTVRRRRRVTRELDEGGRWVDEDEVRSLLRDSIPLPGADDFPVADPPDAEDGLELLPMFFDGRDAPVAMSRALGGWEIRELRPEGGFGRSLGVVPPPDRPPRLEPAATECLRGYLRYWLERDALFGTVHLRMLESGSGTVTDWVADELGAIGALTMARAEVRAKSHRGEVDRLTAADLLDGVRATDQDLLDRPTWGDRF